MVIFRIFVVALMVAVYLAQCVLLLADTVPLLWGIGFVAVHVLYSWTNVLLYAYLKVLNRRFWAVLLIPVLTTTSTLGIALWMVFRPEEHLRDRYHRRS